MAFGGICAGVAMMSRSECLFAGWLFGIVTMGFSCFLFASCFNELDTEIDMRVSAYCPCEKCCGKWADGITASGHVIQPGDRFVAAPPAYKFGTMVEIPGYGKVPVMDRGGAIKGNRLDVYFPTHQEALNLGVQNLKVRVYQ